MTFMDSLSSFILPEDVPYFDRLKKPNKIHHMKLEITKDDGKNESFDSYRVQYNGALGPYKGGIRFHPQVSEDEVKALSFWMAIKCSVSGIPYGGGKGGIIVDPARLSQKELEKLSREYAKFLAPHIGIDVDVPAPDVNTGPEIMAWMLDEYEKIVGHHAPGTFTGKPLALGGSQAREQATGYGGVMGLEFLVKALRSHHLSRTELASHKDETPHFQLSPTKSVSAENSLAQTSSSVISDDSHIALKKLLRRDSKDVTIAIQGFGNVGYFFARTAHELGYKIVAVSDSKGAIYDKNGLEPHAIYENKKYGKGLKPEVCCGGGCACGVESQEITNEQLLELDVDILVPSALEGVITKDNMKKIKAPIIIEMANGPLTTEADSYLAAKGTIILPDIFANAGGVIGSYLEWVQNRSGWYFDEKEGLQKQTVIMQKAFEKIWNRYLTLEKDSQTLRTAAYLVAVERIMQAEKLRG